jgi:hypothetical protein
LRWIKVPAETPWQHIPTLGYATRGDTMTEKIDAPQVGAPDPELKNSPIFDAENMETDWLDLELETGVCYFNDRTYAIGDFVCSGSELLRCEGRGVWMREGSCEAV